MKREIEHGTSYGEFQRCRRQNGKACTPCRRQAADYLAQWRKERPLAARRAQLEDYARERALWRLARMQPVLFSALVAEEKAKIDEHQDEVA